MYGGDGGEDSPAAGSSFAELGSAPGARKKKSKNQRRFSDDQIKSLESMFETETKLEPRKKLQLASDLGLHPRQVAIWFQNKRARWKSKQMEKDHCALLDRYNSLVAQFETLKEEKQSLLLQLQSLNHLIQESADKGSANSGSENGGDARKFELEANPALDVEQPYEHSMGVPSDDDEYFGLEEEPTLLNMVEPAEDSLASVRNWGNLEAEDLLDQSTSSHQWWDFWS